VAGTDRRVTVRPGSQVGKVNADAGQLEQLLMNLTMHAGGRAANGSEIVIETGLTEAVVGPGSGSEPDNFVRIAVSYSVVSGGRASDHVGSDRLGSDHRDAARGEVTFDSVLAEDESLALSVAHNIVNEHNGFLSVQRIASGGVCLEVLLPRWTEPNGEVPATFAVAPTILLVEPRAIVRAELHKFFEANGLDLLEAADTGEAIALAEMREGPFDLVIAPAPDAASIAQALQGARPHIVMLRIVDEPEKNTGELRRAFTQAILLERVLALLENRNPDGLATVEIFGPTIF
jgi:CheY-like chemotaxis protein